MRVDPALAGLVPLPVAAYNGQRQLQASPSNRRSGFGKHLLGASPGAQQGQTSGCFALENEGIVPFPCEHREADRAIEASHVQLAFHPQIGEVPGEEQASGPRDPDAQARTPGNDLDIE